MIDRRVFLKDLGAASLALTCRSNASAPARSVPIIDTHVHLFDPTRPGGVPWPEKSNAILYKPSLPSNLARVTAGLGIVGAIAIEASPLRSDNDWLLEVAGQSPLIVAVIGDLQPGASDFETSLSRLRKNPLFRGIRYGNLWNRDLTLDVKKPSFLDGLTRLADAGLTFESANPTPSLIGTLAELAQQIPHLQIVIDHLPNAVQPAGDVEHSRYLDELRQLSTSPRVFVKLSEIATTQPGMQTADLSPHRDRLDELWGIFGEDKLMYGSDWPNSDQVLPYREVFRLFQSYARTKSPMAQEKLFWRNSVRAYSWHRRRDDQPL